MKLTAAILSLTGHIRPSASQHLDFQTSKTGFEVTSTLQSTLFDVLVAVRHFFNGLSPAKFDRRADLGDQQIGWATSLHVGVQIR